MEKVYADFLPSLHAGHLNENVIIHEMQYRGIPVTPTVGKNDYDCYLPDGRSCEIKIDFRSQATGMVALEYPTLRRGADIFILTTTTARVFSYEQIAALYSRGKVVKIGDQQYDGRIITLSEYYNTGEKLYQFINGLKQ